MKKEKIFSLKKDDFEIQTFKSGGKGGQHQNKTDSGVRIIHKETGISSESRSEKSQHQNKKIAFKKLTENPKFKVWLNKKVYEIEKGKTTEQLVDEMMKPENLKVEVKDKDGKWVLEND